jgi:N-acetyl-anhydromuramyl-L-alanine amidase AmpD
MLAKIHNFSYICFLYFTEEVMPLNIKWIGSPNFTSGRNGEKPQAIVIHIMEGTLSGTDGWFNDKKSKVSAHYGIGTSGEIHQYVKDTDSAWHAGRVDHPAWKNIRKTGGSYKNPNLYTLGIEHEGIETSDWTPQMYQSSSSLIRELAGKWNIPIDRDHVIGHREIYSIKTCPGEKVDLARLVLMASAIPVLGSVTTKINLNIRKAAAATSAPIVRTAPIGTALEYVAIENHGEMVNGNSKWYEDPEGNYFWSGGVE